MARGNLGRAADTGETGAVRKVRRREGPRPVAGSEGGCRGRGIFGRAKAPTGETSGVKGRRRGVGPGEEGRTATYRLGRCK